MRVPNLGLRRLELLARILTQALGRPLRIPNQLDLRIRDTRHAEQAPGDVAGDLS